MNGSSVYEGLNSAKTYAALQLSWLQEALGAMRELWVSARASARDCGEGHKSIGPHELALSQMERETEAKIWAGPNYPARLPDAGG